MSLIQQFLNAGHGYSEPSVSPPEYLEEENALIAFHGTFSVSILMVSAPPPGDNSMAGCRALWGADTKDGDINVGDLMHDPVPSGVPSTTGTWLERAGQKGNLAQRVTPRLPFLALDLLDKRAFR